jgi:hypothetical protein
VRGQAVGSATEVVVASFNAPNEKSKFFGGVAEHMAVRIFGVSHDNHVIQSSNLDAFATGAET